MCDFNCLGPLLFKAPSLFLAPANILWCKIDLRRKMSPWEKISTHICLLLEWLSSYFVVKNIFSFYKILQLWEVVRNRSWLTIYWKMKVRRKVLYIWFRVDQIRLYTLFFKEQFYKNTSLKIIRKINCTTLIFLLCVLS